MTKGLCILCSVLLAALAFAGCTGEQPRTVSESEMVSNPVSSSTEKSMTEAVPPQDGNQELLLPDGYSETDLQSIQNLVGYAVHAPNLSSDARYGWMEKTGTVAIAFKFEGTVFTLEMGSELLPAENSFSHMEEDQWVGFPFVLRWDDQGAGQAEWTSRRYALQYRLYSPGGLTKDVLREVAVILLPED